MRHMAKIDQQLCSCSSLVLEIHYHDVIQGWLERPREVFYVRLDFDCIKSSQVLYKSLTRGGISSTPTIHPTPTFASGCAGLYWFYPHWPLIDLALRR
jgi:hypothetical protein